jgi:hypothetical protein
MFGASCLDIAGLEDKIRSLNAASRDAPFKASSLRERGLIMADWHRFGQWLMQQKDITTKKCNQEMDRLYLRRWAIWHVMGSPEAMVPKEKSMSPVPLNSTRTSSLSQKLKTQSTGWSRLYQCKHSCIPTWVASCGNN